MKNVFFKLAEQATSKIILLGKLHEILHPPCEGLIPYLPLDVLKATWEKIRERALAFHSIARHHHLCGKPLSSSGPLWANNDIKP